MAPELQRLEDAARIAMGGFDDSYAITMPAHATGAQWFARAGYAVTLASLCVIMVFAAV